MLDEEDGLPAPVKLINVKIRLFLLSLKLRLTYLMWEVQRMKITEDVASSLYRCQTLEMGFVLEQRLLQL